MSYTADEFIKKHAYQLLVLVFMIGVIYTQFNHLQQELTTTKERLRKKIKKQSELEDRIRNLEMCNK